MGGRIFALLIVLVIMFVVYAVGKASPSNTSANDKGDLSLGFDNSAPSSTPEVGGILSTLFGNGIIDGKLGNITSSDTTWINGYELGDKIWVIANAIAYAEGANIAGSVPDRLNNPGDITDGASKYGVGFTDSSDGSQLTHFPDKSTGWKWLYDKIKRISNNTSGMGVNSNSTWEQIAQKWATNWRPWVNIVTNNLGVESNSTIGEFLNS